LEQVLSELLGTYLYNLVKNNLFDIARDPADDRITKKLGPLHVYQLSIPAPQPDINPLSSSAIKRGDVLFSGKCR